MDDVYPAIQPHEFKAAAHGRVLDVLHRLRLFALVVADQVLEVMIWRQIAAGDVAVLVDRGAQHCPTVLAIPSGIVGPASEKRNSERRSADDHGAASVQEPRWCQSAKRPDSSR